MTRLAFLPATIEDHTQWTNMAIISKKYGLYHDDLML